MELKVTKDDIKEAVKEIIMENLKVSIREDYDNVIHVELHWTDGYRYRRDGWDIISDDYFSLPDTHD